jgi:hypothetical protein
MRTRWLAAWRRWCHPVRMARRRTLQQAKAEHYDFALHLYFVTMRPYLQELTVWDEQQQRASFAAQWEREEVRIISVDGKDVGWLQVAELPTEIRLRSFRVAVRELGDKITVQTSDWNCGNLVTPNHKRKPCSNMSSSELRDAIHSRRVGEVSFRLD